MERLGLLKKNAPALLRGAGVLALVAWLPLLVLSFLDGYALGGVPLPFLYDFGAHTRLLFAVPLLVAAEVVLGARLGGAAAHFVDRGIVRPEDGERFKSAVAETLRLRDSAILEAAILVFAYLGSFVSLTVAVSHGVATWDIRSPAGPRLTAAGIWNYFVGVPLFQFLIYRTLLRLLNWGRFLWLVSRLDLHLVPTHPDKAGGLGFLGGAHRPLGIIAVALGSVLGARYTTEILYEGGTLASLRAPVASLVAVMLVLCLGPLVVFAPRLLAARRNGLREYGALAFRYTAAFDRKWLRGGAPEGEELLGSGDIQSLADMGGSFERIEHMRPVPFGFKDVTSVVAACLVPMAPVLATVMPLEEVVKTVLKILG
jgi:hypothetical protein